MEKEYSSSKPVVQVNTNLLVVSLFTLLIELLEFSSDRENGRALFFPFKITFSAIFKSDSGVLLQKQGMFSRSILIFLLTRSLSLFLIRSSVLLFILKQIVDQISKPNSYSCWKQELWNKQPVYCWKNQFKAIIFILIIFKSTLMLQRITFFSGTGALSSSARYDTKKPGTYCLNLFF